MYGDESYCCVSQVRKIILDVSCYPLEVLANGSVNETGTMNVLSIYSSSSIWVNGWVPRRIITILMCTTCIIDV